MPPKTYAHGGAIRLALDRPGDDGGVIVQRSNQRMLVQKRQRFLFGRLTQEQLADRPQPIAVVRNGRFTGIFQGVAGMFLRQGEQALQHACPFDAAGGEHRLGPGLGVWADQANFVQQINSLRVPAR